jgi:hypothetical protein
MLRELRQEMFSQLVEAKDLSQAGSAPGVHLR